ncbi:stage V sporulation protein B [uncultured Clostridium sp.]|uniref:stage V sporulation protein B n=1 Tax=uncultured Clostridium sp. TaxID=59620 RepID=UPI0028E5F408|nr:stage V sporulation protein B [uncultured Clostridium sp.]
MKKDSFFRDSFILIVSNLITGIFGFTFSIILSLKLGPEGMGLYGLVMPIYNLFICLICGGMVTAVSKVAAEYWSKKDFTNLKKTVHITLIFDMIWSLIVVLLVFFSSSYISKNIIKDMRSINSLKVICPAMIFVAFSSILKGFFYGISKVSIPAIIDILEKALRIVIIISVTTILPSKEIASTVTSAYIALAFGEFISALFLYIFYKFSCKNNYFYRGRTEGRAQLLFNVLIMSIPLSLNGFLSTALSTISTLIIPRRLISSGLDYSSALSLIGKLSGMSMSVVFFPMVVINSISIVLIPDLSQSLVNKNHWETEERIRNVFRISFTLGLSTLIICSTIPDALGSIIFKRNDLAQFILLASFTAPFVYTSATTFGILNGLGRQGALLKNSLIVSIMEIILLYILVGIPKVNIYGYGFTVIITSITTLVLNLKEINNKIHLDFDTNKFLIIILTSILMYFLLNMLKNLLPNSLGILKYLFIVVFGFSQLYLCKLIIDKSE